MYCYTDSHNVYVLAASLPVQVCIIPVSFTCMVARQQRKNSTTLALRKSWQTRGCRGPQPQCWSASPPDEDFSSTSADDDSDLVDGVVDQSAAQVDDERFLLALARPAMSPPRPASAHRSGRSVSVVPLERIVGRSIGHGRVQVTHQGQCGTS